MKSMADSQFTSQTNGAFRESGGVTSSLSQQMPADLTGNVKSASQTITISESLLNDSNKIHGLNAIPSNIGTQTASSSNANYAASNFLQPFLMGGDGETNTVTTSTTTTGIMDGGGSSSAPSSKMSRKPKNSFRRKKTTTIITDIDNGVDANNGGLDEHYIGYEGQKGSMFSNNIVSTTTPSSPNRLATNSLQLNSMGGNSKSGSTSTMTGVSDEDGSSSTLGIKMSQKPGGSFRRVKTTTFKQDLNGDNSQSNEFSTHNIGLNNGNNIPPKISNLNGNSYSSKNVRTESGKTKNELNSSQMDLNFINLPDSFRRAQTTTIYENGNRAEDSSNNQMAKFKFNTDGEMSSSNNNAHYYNMGYDSKDHNNIDDNGYLVAMGNHMSMGHGSMGNAPMPPKPSRGSNSSNGGSKKQRKGNKKVRGRGSKATMSKSVSNNSRTKNMNTRSKTKSKAQSKNNKSKSCNCGRKLNIRDSSSGSDSESDESAIHHKPCDHPKINYYDYYQTDKMLSAMPPGLDSTMNMIRPPKMKGRMKTGSPPNSRFFGQHPPPPPHMSHQNYNKDSPTSDFNRMLPPPPFPYPGIMNQYGPSSLYGPPPNPQLFGQHPPPPPHMSLQSYDMHSPTPDFNKLLPPPPFSNPGIMNLMMKNNENSEFKKMDLLNSESLTSNTLSSTIGNTETSQGNHEYIKTTENENTGILSPPEIRLFQLEPMTSLNERIPGQNPPPPRIFINTKNDGKGFSTADLSKLLPSPHSVAGFINSHAEQEQQINDITGLAQSDSKSSKSKQVDLLKSESMTSNTQNSKISNTEGDQGTRYVETINEIGKIGNNNPLKVHVVKLESLKPPNEQVFDQYLQSKTFSHMPFQDFGKGFQTLEVKKFLPPPLPFMGLSNLPSEKTQQTNDITGLTQSDGENSDLNQIDTLNSKYIMITNTQSSTTNNSFDTKDAEHMGPVNSSEKKDGNYSPDEHVLQTKSYTPPNQQSIGQYIPQTPFSFMPFQNNYSGSDGDKGGSGNSGSSFSVYDWRKYLPSFMNLPSGQAQEQHKNIVQNDDGNSGLQQVSTFNSNSITTDAQSNADGNSNDGRTKTTKTTKIIGGDNPKEVHIVQSQTMKPGDKGFGYSYSYSY